VIRCPLAGSGPHHPVFSARGWTTVSDLLALTKPHITALSVAMGGGAFVLAQGAAHLEALRFEAALAGIGCLVGAAGALNMYLERETDRLMQRTSSRPLPDRRLRPRIALVFGLSLAGVGLLVTAALVNLLTAVLGALALGLYLLLYTPLKRVTSLAMVVGAVAGAAPPLMGWTAATGAVGKGGLVLFLVVGLWQVPHFLAVALCRSDDYARAGIRTVPLSRGVGAAKAQILLCTALLLPGSLLLVPLGLAGLGYACVAASAGTLLLLGAMRGLRQEAGATWARGMYRASLAYLPALGLGLMLEAVAR
jgi:protoheme IX farnesyltransferase